jgi:hypothetical protein
LPSCGRRRSIVTDKSKRALFALGLLVRWLAGNVCVSGAERLPVFNFCTRFWRCCIKFTTTCILEFAHFSYCYQIIIINIIIFLKGYSHLWTPAPRTIFVHCRRSVAIFCLFLFLYCSPLQTSSSIFYLFLIFSLFLPL